LDANELEIKQRAQRGMTFLYSSQKTDFLGRKNGIQIFSKIQYSILVKIAIFLSSFSVVAQPNQGVQLTDRLF